ncbi:hypothetical protein H8356DRAFT_1629368 [Neocallimastix lanati (nom. inval.)]|nr:hypothetical protein H8356DRAFT_1629368 [Neocallimastix sp. JGI-2020a]
MNFINENEKQLCLSTDMKNTLKNIKNEINNVYLEKDNDYYKFIVVNESNDIINSGECTNTVEYTFNSKEIVSLEDLCIDDIHHQKLENIFNKNNEDQIQNSETTSPISSHSEDYCSSTNGNKLYTEFKHHTFNYSGFYDYNDKICKFEAVSTGPSNYYSINPEEQKVQINGYIHCYHTRMDKKIEFSEKIRIENL